MKDRVIVTSVIGKKYQDLWDLTGPTVEHYADRIGADILVLENNPHNATAHWVKFALHNILKDMYRRAIWVDADLIIRDDAPDLFEMVPDNQLGAFNEGRYTQRAIAIYEAMFKYKVELPKWDRTSYFNTGVLVVSQEQRHLFNDPEGIQQQRYNFGEQTYLNLRILQREVAVCELPPSMNRMSCMDQITGISRLASHIVHYAGYPGEGLLDTIVDDRSRWEADGPVYSYDPVLFLDIGGGLGDQVCAEPVIRYIREVLYPTADIYAIASYPELFTHIPGITVANKMPLKEFDAVYSMDLHPSSKTAHSQYNIYAFSHPVDYISLSALKRVLPAAAKSIKLDCTPGKHEVFQFYTDLEELVIVHPGKGWESKTFPLEWWQGVVDGIAASGHRVGVIGRTINDEHGYMPITVPPGGVDFRDKLSTIGLAALLKYAPVLISNDSAPIHIAGAFNNWIILIPTCKHPEHLLPYRHGSIWYKAKALYRNLACDDYKVTPSQIEVHSPVRLVKSIDYYLPSVCEVVSAVNNMIATTQVGSVAAPGTVAMKEVNYEYGIIEPNK